MHATHAGAAVFSELAALPLAAYTTRVENAVLSQYGEELEEVWNKGNKSPGRVLLFEVNPSNFSRVGSSPNSSIN